MRINVNFVLEVALEDLPALQKLADTPGETYAARDFVKAEALDYITGYLTAHGVPFTVVRDREHTHYPKEGRR